MRKLLMFVVGVGCVSPDGYSFASAEDVHVLSAVGMRQVLVELAPIFERATGYRLHLRFDSGAVIVRRIRSGEAADVILVPDDGLRQLAAVGKIAGDSMTAVARSRVGVAVRAGAPRPDIASAAALRQMLLAARTVARPDPAMGVRAPGIRTGKRIDDRHCQRVAIQSADANSIHHTQPAKLQIQIAW